MGLPLDSNRTRRKAFAKDIRSRQRNNDGEIPAVNGLNLVGGSARPPRLPVSIERSRLHLRLLVLVREKVVGNVDLSLPELRACGGAHQRSDVGQHGQVLLVEQSLKLGELRDEGRKRRRWEQ